LTAGGRLILVGAALVVLGSGWAGHAAWRSWLRGGSDSLPQVSAPPPAPPDELLRNLPLNPPLSFARFGFARTRAAEIDPSAVPRLVEWVDAQGRTQTVPDSGASSGVYRVEYSLDEELTEEVFEILRKGRVGRGHAIVLDPRSGRLLAYVATDRDTFPPEQAYPAASIVKVLTAAAMLEESGDHDSASCVYRGNKYRLNRRRLDRPASGRESSLEDALATSNNQCFSQWALHVLGKEKLTTIFERFGWLSPPAPGHDAGRMEEIETKLDLGRLGSGLDGVRVTPLHVASLTSILTGGEWIEPWWVDRVLDHEGRSLSLPIRSEHRRVLSEERARELRSMLVATTTRGTAKSAFRNRRGRPMLGEIRVAGKTGNLTGRDPFGRYEWFMGLAPVEDPKIAVVVLQLQSNLWWSKSSELAARILKTVFCDKSGCRAERANRWTGDLGDWAAPLLISNLEGPLLISRSEE
jgi:cell division protein FtsI/penicillin-binding protein 2